ncbi:hypothetical protein Q1695_004329 [Nippostrongylus brasiliensis]|nr:hypothetical protein Q1695_004329 [Nippostrongylus brasiliensis]
MESLDWDEKGIRVDGKFLSNLRFADDIVIIAKSTSEAETMLRELDEARRKIGLPSIGRTPGVMGDTSTIAETKSQLLN